MRLRAGFLLTLLVPCIALLPPVHGRDAAAPRVDQETEQVLEAALKWIAAQQLPSGAWSMDRQGASGGHPVAMTGYVLLALMAAGHLPDEGEYGKNVRLGMEYLLENIQPDGLFRDVEGKHYMYNHGVATVALTELYGQTQDPALRPKLERAVGVILRSQDGSGGWRYRPRPSGADISVTVMQAVALRAAQNAGFAVPQKILDDAVAYVRSCAHRGSGAFCYQPGKKPGFARTSAAIYSLQVLGLYEDELIPPALDYMWQKKSEREWFTYGHYYAAPASYMVGGEYWQQYYGHMRNLLIKEKRGENGMVYWDGHLDGKRQGAIYHTAVNVHILAMPYNYLPLYQR